MARETPGYTKKFEAIQVNKMTEDERLITRSEVEERFGISKRFLEKAVASGEGPSFVRVGRSVRYSIQELRSWIKQNTSNGGTDGL